MPEIIDLDISDEEYLQLVEQGKDPVIEKRIETDLVKLGGSREKASLLA